MIINIVVDMIFDFPIRESEKIGSMPALLNVEVRNAQDNEIIALRYHATEGRSVEMPPRTPTGFPKYVSGD